jgi:crossover junction endodeoxyribonuclease RuvC
MLTLGIDPGTAITGYGLVEGRGDGLTLVECGIITTPAGDPLPRRLQTIYAALTSLVQQHHPADAAIEELFFSRNARTALAVGHARGVAMLAVAMMGLPIFEYTPLQVKQAVTGYGRADKAQVQAMVRVLLGLATIPQPDDAADAVAIAICHLQTITLRQKLGIQ